MQTKLSDWVDITEKRDFGKTIVAQRMQVEVSYDSNDNSFKVENVYITQDAVTLEISKLLSKAPGNPLDAILSGINWNQILRDQIDAQRKKFGKMPSLTAVFPNIMHNLFKDEY